MEAPVPELFRSAIRRAAQLPATHPAELQALRQIAIGLRPDTDEATLRANEYRQLHEHQATLFARGQSEGDLRPDLDPHLLAVTYQGMVDTMLDHLDSDPSLDPHAVADHVADVLLGGIRTQRSGTPDD
jgi:hypothetical protein